MKINDIVSDVILRLKSSGLFDDARITNAFEIPLKPTRLKCIVVVLGIDSAELMPGSIDNCLMLGEVKLFADIYIPFDKSALCAQEVFSSICTVLSDYTLSGVSVQRLYADEAAEAFVMKTGICIKDYVDFGGCDNE